MRILLAIPHYYEATAGGKAGDGREHGSSGGAAQPRVEALCACLLALRRLNNQSQCYLDHARKGAHRLAQRDACSVDVVICTTQGRHLLDRLPLPHSLYRHHETDADPLLLGFECHVALRAGLGSYDTFGYLEDDLAIRDGWLFRKLAWFTHTMGTDHLLQPNRYEVGLHPLVDKVYLDGLLDERITAAFREGRDRPSFQREVLGVPVEFERPLNPHAGCFFLSSEQMAHWARQPYFLDRDTRLIGPLESAATLGIMRTFQIYKPALVNADFLEIQHHGNAYLRMIDAAGAPSSTEREPPA
jgi:hypothetical protein